MFARFWKHTITQPFISATAFAALVHSTWSLGTLFAGQAPRLQWSLLRADAGAFTLDVFSLAYWLLPALAIAFALDVGQVATAHDIQSGKRNWRKYATFGVFALATYYLQFVYIAHHMPALELGAGVAYPDVVNAVRNAGLWVIPALLPASTLLYTFSHDANAYTQPTIAVNAPRAEVSSGSAHALPDASPRIDEPARTEEDTAEVQAVRADALERAPKSKPRKSKTGKRTNESVEAAFTDEHGSHGYACVCGQVSMTDSRGNPYASLENAVRAHSAHSRYCKGAPA